MNKNFLTILVSLILIFVVAISHNIQLVDADSGFDTSYDSGGSDFSSSSDWDSSSGGGGSGSPVGALVMIYTFWGLVGFGISKYNFEEKKKKKFRFLIIYILSLAFIMFLQYILCEDNFEFKFCIILENALCVIIFFLGYLSTKSQKVKKLTIDGIDDVKIVEDAFENYKELQIAWMNFDGEKIKELVSDEMYNMYMNQLETLKIKNQQNMMEEIEYVDGYITGYKKSNNKEIFKIYMSVRCYDYIINTKTNIRNVLHVLLPLPGAVKNLLPLPNLSASVRRLPPPAVC